MKIKSLGLKISLLVALIIAVIIGGCFGFLTISLNTLIRNLAGQEAQAANVALGKALADYQDAALTRSTLIANESDVVNAILQNDRLTLKQLLTQNMAGLDVITLCDANGNVLARGDSDQAGDSVLNQLTLATALKTGTGMSTIEKGSVVGLSIRGSAAIKDKNGNIIGAVTCGNDLSKEKYVDDIKLRSNCEVTIFDGDTRLSTTLTDEQGNRTIGTKASDQVIETVLNQREDYSQQMELFGSQYAAYYSPLIREDHVLGMLFVGVNIDETLAEQKAMMHKMLLLAVASGIISIIVVLLFSFFSVSRPLKKIGVLAEKISSGDIGISSSAQSIIDIRSTDEIGALAKKLEQAYMQLRGYVREIQERMQGLVDGDLLTESTYAFEGDFILIKDSINSIVGKLNQVMSEVSSSAAQVSSGAKQIADGSQSLAQGSTEQAAAIEELSASISESSRQTHQSADVTREAADLSRVIKNKAETGSQQMEHMMQAVQEINGASEQISKVIKVIDDIAFQTNILALNAAVEAARAGQHGKGFAVVAEEVRSLAAKSAEAAKDTSGLIENTITKTNLGLKIAHETSASLQEIVEGINRSAEIVDQIAKSSDEQAMAIMQVNTGIDQVAQVVQQNSATAEESAAASEEMNGQSDLLAQLISHFKVHFNDDSSGYALPFSPSLRQIPEKSEKGSGFTRNDPPK